MFNNSLKNEALKIHENTLNRYNQSHKDMLYSCEHLYKIRVEAIEIIALIQNVVNSVANTPKDFNMGLGKIGKELLSFKKTEEYAKESFDKAKKEAVNVAIEGVAAIGVAAIAPAALMGVATTFGSATTGIAISALSGAAAQKAAIAWIGRTFLGFMAEGAGMAAGQAFLALVGPVGFGIAAANMGFNLFSLMSKNQEIADKAIEEAKEIEKVRETVDETIEKVNALKDMTHSLFYNLSKQRRGIMGYINQDYFSLKEEEKLFLGTLVNNTLTLSELLNKTIV